MALVSEPHLPGTWKDRDASRRLIVLIDQACLESVKVGKNYELLNCDDHQSILRKHQRDTGDARPDITHQVCGYGLDAFH